MSDSHSEGEFEGFDAEDILRADANDVVDMDLGLDLWNRGDHAQPILEFHTGPDFETMAKETDILMFIW